MVVVRGEICLADLNPTKGSEQSGIRPVLIVQTNKANATSSTTIIVPLTTKIKSKWLTCHVEIKAVNEPVAEDSVILCEQSEYYLKAV